ncbi:hypothetical protein ABGB16_22090 [Micromonospora sp. B11E3]|uniref:hypothetical protein n=1 Tax=Micromonospora sp. B11E3 TaxID=3153562 RepID=UPI00325ED639
MDVLVDRLVLNHLVLGQVDRLDRHLVLATTGRSARSGISCCASPMSARTCPAFSTVIGSRSTYSSSCSTGTLVCTFSVTMYLGNTTLPTGWLSVPTRIRSSDRFSSSPLRGARCGSCCGCI